MFRLWREFERFRGKKENCMTVILTTRGCRWRKCTMCSYWLESRDVNDEMLKKQIDLVFERVDTKLLKIFTSGSFFDENEISTELRRYLVEKAKKLGVEKIIVESRPEFIDEEKLEDFEGLELEVGIGLETANDLVREICINKGFSFFDFFSAAEILKRRGFRVKCYLLLKPPFISEREAILDILESVDKVSKVVDVISINMMNVQRGTLVEKLWKRNLYRPPWLWSAVEVIKKIKKDVEIICDPVAGGKIRGPHNCGKCDREVVNALKLFSVTQDKTLLDLNCECRILWNKSVEIEDFARIPLI
ncbi:MAG: archaeosine biosynthesis radical SAM protein RaSEA [Archaeoglobaceae archaeon]|nr:archaeosine biosynthesis radical SAM protein RaSEA [Archaeoglobaceae archaeon]MDW7989542.1 archaeosine biosynthesis radical SAM protein RaSEA [Archaeoglobaceae archaeon]